MRLVDSISSSVVYVYNDESNSDKPLFGTPVELNNHTLASFEQAYEAGWFTENLNGIKIVCKEGTFRVKNGKVYLGRKRITECLQVSPMIYEGSIENLDIPESPKTAVWSEPFEAARVVSDLLHLFNMFFKKVPPSEITEELNYLIHLMTLYSGLNVDGLSDANKDEINKYLGFKLVEWASYHACDDEKSGREMLSTLFIQIPRMIKELLITQNTKVNPEKMEAKIIAFPKRQN